MNGFKPTGYGPSAGFKFPPKFGFTGSTGSVTQVSPYTRRLAKPFVQPKAFADGGFVREDNPRMRESSPGDEGSALVRRAKSYCALDQESGGKTPLRPGYKKGGMAKKGKKPSPMMMKKADGGMVRQRGMGALSDREVRMMNGAPRTKADGALTDAERKMMDAALRSSLPKKAAPATAIKEKFYADGGKVARGSSAKGFWASMKDVPALINAAPALIKESAQGAMRRTQQDVSDTKRRHIDRIVDSNGASNYARGGKARSKTGMTKC